MLNRNNMITMMTMGLLMPATDPTYPTLNNVSTRRTQDYLEVAIKPDSGTTVVWVRVPLLSDLGPFTPDVQTTDKPLFVEADGTVPTLKSSTNNGGTISFATASHSTNAVFKAMLKAAAAGTPLVYKAWYKSLEVRIQGQATLSDRGMQGGSTDIPDWGFDLRCITAQYVDSTGELIY
jgi:hypothetical protein